MDYYENNMFARTFYEMYEATYNSTFNVYKFKNKKWKWYKKAIKHALNIKQFEAYTHCNTVIACIDDMPVFEFDTYYDFAEFIKIMEKVIFYKNDEEALIACDAKLSDNKKVLVAQLVNGKIIIEMWRQDEHERLVVSVIHNYGRQMSYRYEFVDGNLIDSQNQSDIYLIKTADLYMRRMMSTFYAYIITCVGYKGVEEFMRGDFHYEPNKCPEDDTKEIDIESINKLTWEDIEFMTFLSTSPDAENLLKENKTIYYSW